MWVSDAKYDSEEAAKDAIVDFWRKKEGYIGSETRRAAALASTTVAAEAAAMQDAPRQCLEYILIHIFVGYKCIQLYDASDHSIKDLQL